MVQRVAIVGGAFLVAIRTTQQKRPGKDDEVIGMLCIKEGEGHVLVVSEKGYGKRSDIEDYRITNRGGKGVKTINITEKTGQLISIKNVTDDDDLMIINRSGVIIRIAVSDLRVMGRATQGVRLINLRKNDSIAAVAKVDGEEELEEELADAENALENKELDTSEEAGDSEDAENGKDVDNTDEEN